MEIYLIIAASMMEENLNTDEYRKEYARAVRREEKLGNYMLWLRVPRYVWLDLVRQINLPATFQSDRRYICDGEMAFRLAVTRISFPVRLQSVIRQWNDIPNHSISWVSSILSEVYHYFEHRIFSKLNNLRAFEECLRARRLLYAKSISDKGSPYKDGVFAPGLVVGFVDGTQFSISRPSRGGQYGSFQRKYYNGMKKRHTLGFLGVSFPDGLFFLFGPYKGTSNDYAMVRKSGICEVIHRINMEFGEKSVLYGDSGVGYGSNRELSYTIVRPLNEVGRTNLNELRANLNKLMSTLRVEVEWSFGWLKGLFKSFELHHIAKIGRGMKNFSREIRFAVMYLNFLNCSQRYSPATDYFKLYPPSLEEYMSYFGR